MTETNTMSQRELCELCESLSVVDPRDRTPEDYAALCTLAHGLADRVFVLQEFKNYVHKRLDRAGIPTDPDGEHSKAGCRIGDRLDIALSKPINPPDFIDMDKLPAVSPKESAWCLLRCGTLTCEMETDDEGGFYIPNWDVYWTADGYAFSYSDHERNLGHDVIVVISSEDMRAFLVSHLGKAA